MMDIQQIRTAVDRYLSKKGFERMELRAAMFDMDGVLYDSMKNHARAWYQAMQHFGYTDFTESEAYLHEGRTGSGTINIVSQRMFGQPAPEEKIQEIYAYKSEVFNKLPRATSMPGAYDLLLKVKHTGVVPMIVTGSGQSTLLGRLNSSFPDIFRQELMVTAFDVKYGKPNPEPYLMGMQKYRQFTGDEGIKPNNFVVIENAPLGIRSAVGAGVFTIAVNTGPLPDSVLLSEGVDLLFRSMQELSDWWEEFAREVN